MLLALWLATALVSVQSSPRRRSTVRLLSTEFSKLLDTEKRSAECRALDGVLDLLADREGEGRGNPSIFVLRPCIMTIASIFMKFQ